MDGSFCQGEPLWDYQLAWNTTSPRLTQCFQKTIPVWIPAIFVWLFGPLDIYYILSRHRMRGPSSAAAVIVPNFYNITRLVLVGLIVALNLVKFSYDVYYFFNPDPIYLPTIAAVVASAINLFSFALFGILINIHRQYGVHTSSIAWLFTFLEFILSLPVLYMFLAFYGDNEVLIDPYRTGFKEWNFVEAVIFCGHFMALTFVFVMTCFADQRSARRAPSVESLRNVAEKEENGVAMRSLLINGSRSKIAVSKSPECPSLSASFFSDMTYWWFNSMAYLGFKKTLQLEDLWELNPEDLTVNITPQFDHNWNGNSASAEAPPKVVSSDNSDVEFAQNCQEGGTVTATCRTFGFYLLGTVLFKFVHDCLQFVSPQLLKLFIEFISKSVDVEPVWHGVFIAVCFFVVSTVQSVLLNKYFHLLYSVQMRIRSALISKIYRKSLELANSSRKESTSGEIVNLMSVDAQKFVDLFPFINLVWSAPFQIILTIVFLWAELGPSVLAGLAVMILLMPLNAWLSTYQRKLQIVQMKKKDERVKVVNEVLNGIKVIKLYGWEVPFINKLNLIRGAEISNLMKISYVSAVTSFLWTCAPFMVSFVSFAIYILSSTENVLDAKKAFVSLSLFNLLRFPLTMLPPMITSLVMASVSIKRLNRFLNSPQLEDYVHREDIDGDAIRISGGHFKWEMGKTDKSKESEAKKEDSKPQENGNTEQDKLLNDVEANGKGNAENKFKDFQLKGVDLKIKKGSLVAIVGRVGSGKSSLLSAILGNMERKDGTVTLDKSSQMAYVAQQAWIQNATLKENILFGNVPNPTKYKHVIDICALKPDISILPGGDQTEIGEKGINLSGGQKQRVAIARACYSDSNVILMDDPLSAVDSHVARHIFGHVISNQTGFLKNRTRVLVTNQISFLSEMDQIVVMVDGAITEVGTYDDLIAKSGKFSEFVKEYANDSREESENEDEFSNEENSPVRERTLSKIRERSISISSTKGSNSGTLGRSKSQKEEQEEQKLIEAERAETGNVKFSIYLTYFRSLTFLWLSIMLVGFVGMQVASVYSNIWLALWSNDHKTYNGTQEDIELRNQRLYVYGCLGFLQALFVLFGALAMARGTIYSSRTLHRGLLNRIMRAPMSFFDTTPLGRIVNRFAKDIDTVDSTIPHNLRGWLICFLQVISTFILISYEVPVFLFVAVVVLTIYYYIQKFYVATSRQLKRLESITRSPIYSHFGETLSGVFTIRAFGASKKFIEESNKRVDTNQRCFFPSFIANRWLALRLEFCGNLIVFSATGFAVFYRESFQSQPGFAGLIITYALSVTSTLNWLVRMTSEIETNVVSVERIDEYCNIESEREWNRTVNADPHIPDGWPSEGGIKFENYSVRYRQELDLVLNGLSLNIKPHEKIGIVGRTGSGKSTTTLALFRILESSAGRIQIDDIDISKIGLHELRSKISIIPQDPVLFSGTIRSNLDPFETYGDADLWEALEHAHLKSYVSTLEQGLDYPVAENGENLSLGQRQLVCLGRALLRKNQVRVIVLDEATAAVDLETDSLIQNTIRSEFTDCTILTIAHRLNTILDSDRVLVLDHGKIEEFDSPKNLLADRKSRFYALAKDARIV